ncbi:MAG: penicillin-binding protein 2 [Nitrospirae bacterium]|nr:penicillin-binding protein 2 [Nitrospirota bacterium]
MDRRIVISIYIVIAIFCAFLVRLWDLQVIKGEKYRKLAESNRLRVVETPAPRGIIYDRNNLPLVRNIQSFDISFDRENLPKDHESLASLGRLIGLEPEDVMARIKKGGKGSLEPVRLKQNATFKDVAMAEARRIDFPGLQVDVTVSRDYIYGQLAGHVIGYLGRLTLAQASSPEYDDVPREAFVGQWGTEKNYDTLLRGTAAKKIIEVDAVGRVIKDMGINDPVKGRDIRLTIDKNVQQEAEKNLLGSTGAVVVLNANTGEVLALASAPAFDPNLFAKGINYRDWQALLNDPQKPLLNRAIQSQYPPGSTFKIVSAIAALEEGVITDSTSFNCSGSINFGRRFRCWKDGGHGGGVDLYRGLVGSCDVYFYEIGKRISIDKLARYAFDFGLGEPTGIELEGERSGTVPTTEWKLKTKKEKWYRGETLNAVIGQGYVTATPIQMARLVTAAVNGGKLYRPHILKDFFFENNTEKRLNLSAENIYLLKRALAGVVTEGTGGRARSKLVSIGGKTGTSQVIAMPEKRSANPEEYRDHAWFVAFAPVDNPEIAVAVFVEHGGHGGSAAAPIAKNVIEKYFNCKLGKAECEDEEPEAQTPDAGT